MRPATWSSTSAAELALCTARRHDTTNYCDHSHSRSQFHLASPCGGSRYVCEDASAGRHEVLQGPAHLLQPRLCPRLCWTTHTEGHAPTKLVFYKTSGPRNLRQGKRHVPTLPMLHRRSHVLRPPISKGCGHLLPSLGMPSPSTRGPRRGWPNPWCV